MWKERRRIGMTKFEYNVIMIKYSMCSWYSALKKGRNNQKTLPNKICLFLSLLMWYSGLVVLYLYFEIYLFIHSILPTLKYFVLFYPSKRIFLRSQVYFFGLQKHFWTHSFFCFSILRLVFTPDVIRLIECHAFLSIRTDYIQLQRFLLLDMATPIAMSHEMCKELSH